MEIVPGVYQLGGIWGTGIWGVNVFLIVDKGLTLVDSGFKGRAKRILKEVRQLGYSPNDIANIVVTHHHADHVGNLAALKRITQAKIIAHPADAPYIDGRVPQPAPARPQWLTKAAAPCHRLWATAPVAVDTMVNDGDELPILGGIKIVHALGHTPGSICLFLHQKRLVITGDVITHRFGLRLPSKMWTVDIAQEVHSIKKVAGLTFDTICFGHGSPLRHEAHPAVVNFARKLDGCSQRAGQPDTLL